VEAKNVKCQSATLPSGRSILCSLLLRLGKNGGSNDKDQESNRQPLHERNPQPVSLDTEKVTVKSDNPFMRGPIEDAALGGF
jgi:hypothetical protein